MKALNIIYTFLILTKKNNNIFYIYSNIKIYILLLNKF